MQTSQDYFDICVFIGRFQPVHLGHLKTIRLALERSKKLIIIIGSYKCAPSVRQPWNAKQRMDMIAKCLTAKEKKRVFFVPIRDRIYSEFAWNQNIVYEVLSLASKEKQERNKAPSIALIGHNKDASSYYLKNFPNWKFIETGNFDNINSTDFRKIYFCESKENYVFIPNQIQTSLKKFRKSSQFRRVKEEYLFVEHAKKKLTQTTFDVGNCLIQCGNYILLVRRKHYPGKYLYALPGGHLEKNETPYDGALRELYEETNLQLNKKELKPYFVKQELYAHPDRNPIAHYRAHVFFFRLNTLECPEVFPGDDALEAQWILLDELNPLEDQFFADHYQILQIMLDRITWQQMGHPS